MAEQSKLPAQVGSDAGLGVAGSGALDALEHEALSVLTDDWGTSTNDVGYTCWKRYGRTLGSTPQKRSAAWLQVMLRLERRGLVRRLDDEKPVAWQRVATPNNKDQATAEGGPPGAHS